jgi:protein TonB
LAAVFMLGAERPRGSLFFTVLTAFVLHAAAAAHAAVTLFEMADYAGGVRTWVIERLRSQYDVEFVEPEAPKPEPVPEPEPEPETPKPVAKTAPADEPPPPPAAAEAGEVLTAEPDPEAPVDLTDQGFVTGSGDRFAGGVTAADGTAKTAVRNMNARAEGVPGGQGKAPAPAAPERDLSRAARPLSDNWSCGFPPEADLEQIDYAVVTLVVTVGPDGRAQSVSVTRDPGHGFGRLARQCALRMRYSAGFDRLGRPTARTTPPITVRFNR